MKKYFINLKNNKKLMNWLITSGLTIIISLSLILNIIFIPRYYYNKNNLNQFTQITIDVTEGQNPNKPIKTDIKTIQYNTNLNNLGDLIKSDKKHFIVHLQTLGDYLTGIKDNKGNLIPIAKNAYWSINYWDKNHYLPTPVGMDLFALHNNDKYRLNLENF